MKKHIIALVLCLALLLAGLPARAEEFKGENFSITFPEELGKMMAWAQDGQSYYISMMDAISGKPESEWRMATILVMEYELLAYLPDSMLEEMIRTSMGQKDVQLEARRFEGSPYTFYQATLPSSLEYTGSAFFVVDGAAMCMVTLDNIDESAQRAILGSFRVGLSGEASPAPGPAAGPAFVHDPSRAVRVPDAHASFQVPEGMYALLAHETDSDLIQRQGLTAQKYQQYMELGNFNVFLLEEGETLGDRSYRIWIRVKDNPFSEQTQDFRDLDAAGREMLTQAFLSTMTSSQEDLLGSRQTGGIYFGGFIFMKKQLRYFTVMNNRLFYLTLEADSGEFSQQQKDRLLYVVDSFRDTLP